MVKFKVMNKYSQSQLNPTAYASVENYVPPPAQFADKPQQAKQPKKIKFIKKKKSPANSNGEDIISQLRKEYPDQDFKLESRFGEKKYIVMATLGRKVSEVVSENLKEIGVVGKTSIADIMSTAYSRNLTYPAPKKKKKNLIRKKSLNHKKKKKNLKKNLSLRQN